jgi:glycosyltransferase involved in cell wall biosynthesis
MKVLLIGSKEYPFNSSKGFDKYSGGGIENHVEKLAKYLAREGHDPIVITRRFPGQKDFEKKNGIAVYRTGFVSNKYLRNFSYNLRAYCLAKRIIINENVDLIHAHAVVAGFFGAKLSEKTGVPMIFTPHGSVIGWKFPIRNFLKYMENKALRTAKKTAFISKNAMNELSAKRKSLLTNAIDLDDFKPGKRNWKPIRFLFMGRLLKFKGIIHSLEAFERLSHEYPNAEFLVAGDGETRQEVETFSKKNKKIRYLGWVSDVKGTLLHTDVFVLVSTERGQPIALLESMASGKIVLTSLDFTTDNKTGIRVEQDVEDIHEKMAQICKNFKSFERLGKAARKEIEEKYSWKKVIKQFIKEYKSVTN